MNKVENVATLKEQLVRPFRKESVLADALKNFREHYYQQLINLITHSRDSAFDSDVIDEHSHALTSLDILFDSNAVLSLREKAQLWWCVEDLSSHLKKYHAEISSNPDLSSLLGAIQHLVETKSFALSNNHKREHLYFVWYRLLFELRNTLPTDSIKGGEATLDRWLNEISSALEADQPTRSQNHLANWAAGGLIDIIKDLENRDQFAHIVLRLKQIKSITR